MNMSKIAEIKQDLINDQIQEAVKNGRQSAILAKNGSIVLEYYCEFTDEVNILRAFCNEKDVEYLKKEGFKIEIIDPISKYDYERVLEEIEPKGFFRKTINQTAVEAFKKIKNLPKVVKVSWE